MTPCAAKSKRLLRRPAFPVERHRWRAFGQPGRQRGLPADIARLFRDLNHAAGNHVLDENGIDARPSHERLKHARIEIDRMHRRQRAPCPPPAEGRAHDVDDHCAAHVLAPPSGDLARLPVQFERQLGGPNLHDRRLGRAHQLLHLIEFGRGQEREVALDRARGAHLLKVRLGHERAKDQLVVVVRAVALAQFLDRRLFRRAARRPAWPAARP